MSQVSNIVERRLPGYLEELKAWTRQPSISADGTGMTEMASMVANRLRRAGGDVRTTEARHGYPVIYAEFDGASDKTLLFYNHYDVQPSGSRSDWQFDPFGAQVSEGKVYGRGTADNKGCLLSRIHAVEAVAEVSGRLPVNVKFLVEGEEEIGSPHLEQFVTEHRALLRADACIWEYACKDGNGRPAATLGNKGMCYVELKSRGARADIHSMYASLVPNAAWRLIWALATLKDEHENVLVDGFMEDVKPLSDEEVDALKEIAFDGEEFKREVGVSELLLEICGFEAQQRLYGFPTCTICGVSAGFTGEGARTVLPAVAKAKVDFRLVVDQRPERVIERLREHLDKHGFVDIELVPLRTCEPVKTPVSDPFVDIVRQAGREAYGEPLVVEPTSPGSGPRSLVARHLDIPIVGLGVGYVGSQVHGPDENIRIDDYCQGVKHIGAILQLLSASGAS